MPGLIALWVVAVIAWAICLFVFAQNLTAVLNGDTTFPTVWSMIFFGVISLSGVFGGTSNKS